MNTTSLPRPSHPSGWLRQLTELAPGLLLAGAIAAAATWGARQPLLAGSGLSALTLAICAGLVIGNTVYPRLAPSCHAGVGLAKQRLLRAGIVLYGLRLTFQDIGHVGMAGVVVDALVLGSTFLLAQWLGRRVFGLDARTTVLIGAGSSICGAAAVLATEPVIKGRAEDVAVAVATVVVFGTVGTFLYPALFHWNAAHGWLDMSPAQYGLYVGSTVHEVAQVVAAGEAIAPEAADVAVISKMVRVMMLAPFLLLLSMAVARGNRSSQVSDGQPRRITIPWFALGFVAMAGVNSLGVLPAAVVQVGVQLDNALLAVAMAALGLTTHVRAVRAAGTKPLLLAALLFAWLLVVGLLFNRWVPGLL
ncbi:putative integral membrane protein (TIGR00698 family) [Delftia acidovorans]|uniref:YeiH family protein n=1 Tax=Delftia acidovorans TaxID=80866 RepID=UPI000F4C4621|nr:YeiH family protein [Delftia acidovorans]ROR03618.1 putative integral membrane protein (TIGR00698 family) [Delftia acidovorans]